MTCPLESGIFFQDQVDMSRAFPPFPLPFVLAGGNSAGKIKTLQEIADQLSTIGVTTPTIDFSHISLLSTCEL